MGVDKGLIVNHEYPKDFLLESLQQLFALRKQAIDSYAPYATIESIDAKILTKQSQGDTDNVRWVRCWELFRPFKEFPIAERLTILSELPADNNKKVLYTYFEEIKQLIESEKPDFYKIKASEREQQYKIIDEKIEEIKLKYNIQAVENDGIAI